MAISPQTYQEAVASSPLCQHDHSPRTLLHSIYAAVYCQRYSAASCSELDSIEARGPPAEDVVRITATTFLSELEWIIEVRYEELTSRYVAWRIYFERASGDAVLVDRHNWDQLRSEMLSSRSIPILRVRWCSIYREVALHGVSQSTTASQVGRSDADIGQDQDDRFSIQ